MAHTTLLVEFCLLLPNAIALTSSNSNPLHSFATSNKMFCAQSRNKFIAHDALNLYKSMPRGKLYDGTELSNGKSCKDLGYVQHAGEDPCYPGLQTFYRSKEEGKNFYRELQHTLKNFGESMGLSLDDANMVDSCKCKEKSYARKYYSGYLRKYFGKSCDNALELAGLELSGRNVPHTFISLNKMFCAQAPKNIAKDALILFKSMPRGMLYDGTELNNQKSCEDLGYKSSAGEDPCYPGLKTFYRSKEEGEQFYKELQSTLKEFGQKEKMTLDDVNLMDTCRCKDTGYAKSNIGKWFNKSCDNAL